VVLEKTWRRRKVCGAYLASGRSRRNGRRRCCCPAMKPECRSRGSGISPGDSAVFTLLPRGSISRRLDDLPWARGAGATTASALASACWPGGPRPRVDPPPSSQLSLRPIARRWPRPRLERAFFAEPLSGWSEELSGRRRARRAGAALHVPGCYCGSRVEAPRQRGRANLAGLPRASAAEGSCHGHARHRMRPSTRIFGADARERRTLGTVPSSPPSRLRERLPMADAVECSIPSLARLRPQHSRGRWRASRRARLPASSPRMARVMPKPARSPARRFAWSRLSWRPCSVRHLARRTASPARIST
jgi:hypothetical protein